ncbi:MAG: type II toxin-antitoxin system Phd/YefM family antitoxin [Actinomycetes bacterium]|jgi:prevent-host-death family protein|nr:type II toxin-antitoxin system Phd/YefM family antitoxin [Actinomycetes bacterium]
MIQTTVKFSEDVIALGDLKANPGKVVRQVERSQRPILVTSRGRGRAVVQSLESYEANQDELAFMHAVVQGLADVEAGRTMSLEKLDERLGLS